jgi:putative transposase
MFEVVLWRVRYKLSLNDLAEMSLQRGFSFTHEMVREWELRIGRMLAEHLRRKRHQHARRRRYVDEAYIEVKGQWAYLYRAIHSDGQLVDYPILGFKTLVTAAGFCRAYEEVRNYFRPRQKTGEAVSLGKRRELFIGRYLTLQDQFCVAV